MGNYYSRRVSGDEEDEVDEGTQIASILDDHNKAKIETKQSQQQKQCQSQYNRHGLLFEERIRRRKSWSGHPIRLHHISSSKSIPNLHKSASFRTFASSEDGNKLSPTVDARSVWPITQTETIFLPCFKIYERPLEKEFHIKRLIDSGAFGKVYQVQDKITNDNYALKVLSKANIINSGSVRQIRNEVEIQSICGHHPFIVECIAYWQSRTQIFILLEYVARGELLKIKSFPFELIQIYVAEIAIALDFLQNAGIIYRDLKPENILLDEDGHIKLIDFGLSKWLRIGERTRTVCGTAEYMAPEVFSESAEGYGHAADWWSLGVIVCLMFTRKFPVWTQSAEPQQQLSTPPAVGTTSEETLLPTNIDGIPAAGLDLLKRLFVRDPRKRLRSVRELERIAMFYQFSFDSCRQKKMLPLKYVSIG